MLRTCSSVALIISISLVVVRSICLHSRLGATASPWAALTRLNLYSAPHIPPHLRFIEVQSGEPAHHDHARHIPLEPPGDADLNGNGGMLCHHSSSSAE